LIPEWKICRIYSVDGCKTQSADPDGRHPFLAYTMKNVLTYNEEGNLTDREKQVLQQIIHSYVLSARPVGSRYISKHSDLGLSPASIRNIMAELEERGFIDHPHTSSGRIPTDKGYRYYVDTLMQIDRLTSKEKAIIRNVVKKNTETKLAEILKDSNKILSYISHLLAVISLPRIQTGKLNRIDLIPLSSSRIMIILAIESGLVKTMQFELDCVIDQRQLNDITSFLNSRLAGLTLKEIRETLIQRVKTAANEKTGIIRLFIDRAQNLFSDTLDRDHVIINGVKSIIDQPEFEKAENLRSIIELVEDEQVIIHVLESQQQQQAPNAVSITIGVENEEDRMRDYSFISTRYIFGNVTGTIGVIGPKRMNYSKLVALVDYLGSTISKFYQ